MTRLLFTLTPALIAAGVGVVAQTADTSEGYVNGLRTMFHVALLATWISVAIYVWQKQESTAKRVILSVFLLAVLRVLYIPLLDIGVIGAAWTGRLAAKLGMVERDLLVHAAFGFWMAVIAGPLCMGFVAAVTRPVVWGAKLALVLLVVLAVAAFVAPRDRQPLPHRFDTFVAAERSLPLTEPEAEARGASFAKVILRRGERFSTRVIAFGGMLIEFALPRAGWGGTVRTVLGERCKEQPPESWRAYIDDLEYAFVEARPLLIDEH